jgi:L-histidine N-alpha-methyltransferase
MTHEYAVHAMHDVPRPALLLFIGSSVGNFEDVEASGLLASFGRALGPDTTVLLGTDIPKSPAVLVRAYDDGAGVTAAFNKNVLTRINRELGGHFSLERFQHVASWNETESRIEMHLRSSVAHAVPIDALGLTVRFDAGETIHTESSIKYTVPRAERILRSAGFLLEQTFYDSERRFAVHLARGRPR